MRRVFITVIFCLTTAGCGQKGPLFLPGDKPAAASPEATLAVTRHD